MADKREAPMRVSGKHKAIAQRIAKGLGVNQVDVVSWAIEALEQYYVHHGERILLPLRFHETFRVVSISAANKSFPDHTVLEEPPRGKLKPVRV